MQNAQIKQFPKIELHCHLDGSVSLETLQKIAGNKQAVEEFIKIQKQVIKADGKGDLGNYLKCFDYVLPYLQTEEALYTTAYDLVSQAADEQVMYMEVRFAPLFHCQCGLNPNQVIKAVLRGLEAGERDFGIKSRALLCMMRGQSEAFNEQTLECAKELKEYGVAGLDLAGNEAAYPPELYQALFSQAREWDIPFTIHAGECGSAENVKTSIEMGAKRIGHGIAIENNEEVIKLCKENQIILEMCPVSNFQTGAVKKMEQYPFDRLKKEKVGVTVNTDNRVVSGTTLTREWSTLDTYFGSVNEQTMLDAGINAIEGAFLPYGEKAALMDEFRRRACQ